MRKYLREIIERYESLSSQLMHLEKIWCDQLGNSRFDIDLDEIASELSVDIQIIENIVDRLTNKQETISRGELAQLTGRSGVRVRDTLCKYLNLKPSLRGINPKRRYRQYNEQPNSPRSFLKEGDNPRQEDVDRRRKESKGVILESE